MVIRRDIHVKITGTNSGIVALKNESSIRTRTISERATFGGFQFVHIEWSAVLHSDSIVVGTAIRGCCRMCTNLSNKYGWFNITNVFVLARLWRKLAAYLNHSRVRFLEPISTGVLWRNMVVTLGLEPTILGTRGRQLNH